ncbi:hypothetical protein [Aliikangiella coralliicola]|uniref:Uncharacterized protein n=1 Tax=Aliikangiella coralliicola TaxID=2592383 RepID=A0A545UG97_9GAMM|nr:hypothetical protein [Aliikangiella coralliicola]TQV88499.1 hypothetical protein FLL46_08215 [Aliikangiella coralliicola]
MAESSFNCSVDQGFNFQKDAQCLVGHINSLKIGDKEFAKDIEVMDPTKINDEANKVKVVGVASGIFWEGGFANSVSFTCQFSTTNKQDAALLQHTNLSNTNVECSFTIYDYDPVKKAFYKAFHTNETDLKGLVQKSGGELELRIDMDQSTEVTSPKNYAFYLSVMPQEEEQDIHLAVSVDSKFVKKWGVAVGA